MDKHHFVNTIPLYTYRCLQRWFYFSVWLWVLFFFSCCIIDVPFVWQWYQKKSLYNKQKNIYGQEQELIVTQKALQGSIKQLHENMHTMQIDKQSIHSFLKIILENHEQLTFFSVKKTGQIINLEGSGVDMMSVTNGLKKLATETGYAIRIQSIERKETRYVFYAVCKKK